MKINRYPILVIVMSLSIASYQSYSQVKSYEESYNTLSLKASQKSNSIFFEKDNSLNFDTYLNLSNDSLKKGCCGCIGIYGTKFTLSFDSRQSFVLGRLTKMNGLKIGIEFYDRYRFGFGFYKMNAPIELKPIPIENSNDTIFSNFEFEYSTVYLEYVLYQDYKWEVSVPLSIGTGTGTIKAYLKSSGYDTTVVIKGIPLVAINAAAHYKVFHWMGIGVGLGYRQILTKNKEANEALSSPFYVIKLKIFLSRLYESIFKHNEVIEEREEYKRQREEKRNDKRRSQNKD